MSRKYLSKVMVVLSFVLILSTMLPSLQLAQAKNSSLNVKEVLSNLTDAERRALNQLEAQPGFTIHPDINVDSANPVQVIVEFKQEPAKVEVAKAKLIKKRATVSLSDASKKVDASHKKFQKVIDGLKRAKTEGASEIKVHQAYRDAFNGVAMTIPANMIKDLVEAGIVKRVWNDEKVQLTLPETKGEKAKPKMIDSVPHIGVDELHDEGIKGEGIKVGVIDTGIDYNHPDLTNVYKGYRKSDGGDASKVDPDSVKGWDFVDDDADPMEMTYDEWLESGYPEFDMYGNSYYTAHGTHVSGTIAGQQDSFVDYSVKGVAPEVDLYSYRVLGAYGSGDMNWVIGGIDKAVRDGMDVINLSLGMNANDPLSPAAVAVNNAMLSDVVTVVAAGNAGPGDQTVGTPGAAALSIAVGASDVSQNTPTFSATVDELTFSDVQLLAKSFADNVADLENESLPVVYVGLGADSDFADVDVEGKIALIERGELAFDEKIRNAKSAGAVATIVYNNEAGQIPHYVGENSDYIPSFRLSKEDGESLKKAVNEGALFTFGELGNVKSEGDNLADFSSRGPVSGTYDIKPDVTAPGVAINSTVPSFINDPEDNSYGSAYSRMNGTSMATPHVAGVAALILQQNPDYTPFEVKAALMNTAVDLREDYSVYEVGAGRIDAYDAVHADTAVVVHDQTDMVEGVEIVSLNHDTGSISFGGYYLDGEAIEKSKRLSIENKSNEEKTYEVQVDFLQAKGNRQDASKNGVELEVGEATLTLSPEQKKDLEASIVIPSGADYGVYEGYVRISNVDDPKEKYQVPFAVRVSDKGFDLIELDRHAVTNDWNFHYFLDPFLNMDFRLKSPMETIDVIVTDSETDKPVGYLGTLFAEEIMPDQTYFLMNVFQGMVNPFTDDPNNPISEEVIVLPEGDYHIKMIGVDENGEMYTGHDFALIDNKPAEMSFNDYEPGVIEVDESMYTDEDGHHALWVHTNVYDDAIDVLKEKGLDYDQSSNIVGYYENSFPFPGILPVTAEGEMKFGVLPEEIADGPLKLVLDPIDLATNLGDSVHYTFIKKGTAYAEGFYQEDEVKLGDSVTFTLSLNNVEDLVSGKFDLNYLGDIYEYKDVKLNKEFANFAKENDLSVTLDDPVFSKDNFSSIVTVGASLEGEHAQGVTGNMNFIDVTFEVVSDLYYENRGNLGYGGVDTFTYQNITNEEVVIPTFIHDYYQFISKHAVVYGNFTPEAFMHEAGFPLTRDYEGLGVKAYAKGADGKVYNGTVDEHAQFEITDLPVSDKPYEIIIEVPGHLTTAQKVTVGKEKNGEIYGEMAQVYLQPNIAGDVNGDGVIDIMDVMRIVAMYGKDDKAMDINKDGIVDEVDIRYIEKNFLKVGPGVKKDPVEKLGPKGLNDFLQSLGLQPTEDN
ncbi:S8 family serine peptidase [Virgibacillus soli]|uniref:S8 family serine peptidase n=1 Tax=Paracerasibacillus soli TaxID=480284 RepID=UPI0035EAF2E8